MAENTIVYNGILTPQAYLEIMAGEYFSINTDNQIGNVNKSAVEIYPKLLKLL